MYSLRPALQPYAWGTTGDIPELLGIPRTGGPVAEAWWGDHSVAPARCVVDGAEVGLDRVIAADRDSALGPDLAREFAGRLPFLLKVLAIGSPLSIQVHPGARAAEEGFAREEAAGIPRDSPLRTYRDRSHKPEMLVALTPTVVLSGFRAPAETRRDLDLLDHPGAAELATLLGTGGAEDEGIARFVERCLTGADAEGLIVAIVRAARAPESSGSMRAAAAAAAHFPSDGGVLVALAMNRVDLAPGEASFTPGERVHSYQSGLAVEIMANSDNVVRGGLSVKHVDVNEFLAIASTVPCSPTKLDATRVGGAATFRPGVDEFELGRVSDAAASFPPGPRIVLVIEGEATVGTAGGGERVLSRGEAAFVPFADGALTVAASGLTFVAGCPEPPKSV